MLRRARRRSRGRGASTMSAAGWARGRILVALAFLAWLDDRGITLDAATQADIDDWLHGATRYRYLLRDFLTWASARRLAGKLTVPALPPSELGLSRPLARTAQTAVNWASRTRRDWTACIAERISTPAPD